MEGEGAAADADAEGPRADAEGPVTSVCGAALMCGAEGCRGAADAPLLCSAPTVSNGQCCQLRALWP